MLSMYQLRKTHNLQQGRLFPDDCRQVMKVASEKDNVTTARVHLEYRVQTFSSDSRAIEQIMPHSA